MRQWRAEHPGAPLAGRRARRLVIGFVGEGVADLVEEIAWSAVEAISPEARDEFPWSSATRVVPGPR